MTRITIIETGQIPKAHRERHGSFPDMFQRMLHAEDPAITFDVVSIPNGDALPDWRKLEAVLITGAAAGVYDELDWIAPLEDFVRTAYVQKTPMVMRVMCLEIEWFLPARADRRYGGVRSSSPLCLRTSLRNALARRDSGSASDHNM